MAVSTPGLLDSAAAQGAAGLDPAARRLLRARRHSACALLSPARRSGSPSPARRCARSGRQRPRRDRASPSSELAASSARNVAAALEARGVTVRRLARPELRSRPHAARNSRAPRRRRGRRQRSRRSSRGALEAVHVDGVRNLVAACRSAGVRRLVHVSALGAVAPAARRATGGRKGIAEALLDGFSEFEVRIVRPSLVVGPGGASTALFAALAALPVVPRIRRPGRCAPSRSTTSSRSIARAADLESPHAATHRRRRAGRHGPSTASWTRSAPGSARARSGPCASAAACWRSGARRRRARASAPMDAEAFAMLAAGNIADIGSTVDGARARAASRSPARCAVIPPRRRIASSRGCISWTAAAADAGRLLDRDRDACRSGSIRSRSRARCSPKSASSAPRRRSRCSAAPRST